MRDAVELAVMCRNLPKYVGECLWPHFLQRETLASDSITNQVAMEMTEPPPPMSRVQGMETD